MNLNYIAEGQMSLFDLGTWYGKTSTEHSAATAEKTSVPSSKRPLKLPKGMPLFLDLRTDRNGPRADTSWEIGGALLGEGMTLSTGECRRDANESVWLPILTEQPQPKSYLVLNTGEKPSTPRPSKLSQILETNADPKYNLSAIACAGILRRANVRNKELPAQLREALERQSVSKNEMENQEDAKGITIQDDNDNRKAFGESCMTQEPISFTTEITPKIDKDGVAFSLRSRDHKDPQSVVCAEHGDAEPIRLESNQYHATVQTEGISFSPPALTVKTTVLENHPMDSRIKIKEDGVFQTMSARGGQEYMPHTLHVMEEHTEELESEPQCIGNGQVAQLRTSDLVGTLNCMHDQQAIITYGDAPGREAGPNWDGGETAGTLTANNAGGNQHMPDKSNFNAVITYIDSINSPVSTDCKEPTTVCAVGSKEEQGTHQSVVGTVYRCISKGVSNQLAQQDMYVTKNAIVRRLTPLECERLQGYPDGWTRIGEWKDGKGKRHPGSDGPRYKALGNSIALPFWAWMAERMSQHLPSGAKMASLFDGIGGFPLVYSKCGVEPVWASEIEEFPIAVTKIRFPEVDE